MARFILHLLIAVIFTSCVSNSSDKDEYIIHDLPNSTNFSSDRTIHYLSNLLANDNENDEIYYLRAKARLEKGDFYTGLQDIDKAISINKFEQYYFLKALICKSLSNFSQCLLACEEAENRGNNDYELYNLKAFSLINLKKYTKAFDMLNKSLHVMPNNAETFLYRGLLYANVLDTVKCLQNMNKALQINPYLSEASYYLGSIYISQNNIKQSLYYINTGLDKDSLNSSLNYSKGEIMEKLFLLDSAIFFYKKSLQKNNSLVQAYYKIGDLYYNTRRYWDAELYFQNCIKYNVRFKDCEYKLATTYLFTNKKAQAKEILDRLYKRDSTDKKILWAIYKMNAPVLKDTLKLNEQDETLIVKPFHPLITPDNDSLDILH